MKDKDIREILFYFSLIFIMVMSLNLAVIDSTGMELPFGRIAFFTFIATAAASMIILFPLILPAVFLACIGWAAYAYYTDASIISSYVQKTLDFLYWLYGYVVGYNFFEPEYSLVFAVIYASLAAFVVSFLVYSGRWSFMLILLGTAVLSFFWFIYVEKARLYLVLYLFASILLYSYHTYKRRLREWKAAGSSIEDNIGFNWMLCTAIVVSISIVLSLALPLNIRAVRWPWLNDRIVSAFPFITEWRNDSMESLGYGFNPRYSLNSAGYKGKKLGGEVLLDEAVMMTVKVQGEENIYLRGAVKDRYSGNSWTKSRKGYKEYDSGNAMPLPFGSSTPTYEKTLVITHEKLLTSTIFAPYAVYQVQHSYRSIYEDEDSELYTPKMTVRGEAYTVRSRIPYIDVGRLRETGAGSLRPNEAKLYTALDKDISERTRALAMEITKGKDNAYDKAKAVEGYLRQNYSYTLKPPKLPPKAEFTEHFLFEGKEGYCTYFATSMAVLLRSSGVPCRYVEGFLAKYAGVDERKVRGIDAHAWVEVYFDNYGWVTFEPTPQYPAVEFREEPEAAAEIAVSTADASIENNNGITGLSRRRGDLELEEEAGNGAIMGNNGEKQKDIGNTAMLILFCLLSARFVFRYAVLLIKEYGIRHSKGRQFALNYIKDISWYLGHAGLVIHRDETLREFFKRIEFNHKESLSEISEVTQVLEKIRYSDMELCSEERKMLDIFRRDVKKLALKKSGVLKFFISLYFIGK